MKENKKSAILFYVNYASFIQEDEKILSELFHLSHYSFKMSKKIIPFIKEFFRLIFFSIFKIPSYDIIYCWFADYHSFFPILAGRLYGKKTYIVSGGYDATAIPEIKYGVFLKRNFRAFCARTSFRFADFILPVDVALIHGQNQYADSSGQGYPVGIRHFVKKLRGKIFVIPTGYDPDIWIRSRDIKQKNSVVTIGSFKDIQRYRLKGLDLFIETAKRLPKTEFHIVGPEGKIADYIRENAGSNVFILGFQNRENLPKILSGHKVYAQFSLSEGLPNTLCEAMLCECIPVGSDVNGIPEAIGECGFILIKKDPVLAADLIHKALKADPALGQSARARIMTKFPKEQRKEALIKLLKEA